MKRLLKMLFFVVLIAFVLIQFYPKSNNNISTTSSGNEIEKIHAVPNEVMNILKTSCYDCHSNNTFYPWYANLQPVSMWLSNHVEEGKDELNFSEFGSYSLRRQYKKLKEMDEQITEDEMPLESYTLIHKKASLDKDQKELISGWVRALRDSFKTNYPEDSLKRKNK